VVRGSKKQHTVNTERDTLKVNKEIIVVSYSDQTKRKECRSACTYRMTSSM
jgi:hypothetical protein